MNTCKNICDDTCTHTCGNTCKNMEVGAVSEIKNT